MAPFSLPPGYDRIQLVHDFESLATTPFDAGINALCWPRTLPGDFDEVIRALGARDEVTSLDDASLEALPLSAAGRVAVDVLLHDQRHLRARGLLPVLDCIRGYPRDEGPEFVRTDVYSFHVDSAPIETDTWLCSYTGSSSEGLRNDEARRREDVPEARAELLARFGGRDDDAFRDWLTQHCHDLHYVPVPHARPFRFGVGNLWRIAVAHPGSRVPAFIHRAPETVPGQPPRLLLIS